MNNIAKLMVMAAAIAVSAAAESKDYTGAELYTHDEVQYGKFEARMKMAAGSGVVSSMFLYQNGSEIADGRPWVEIDIEALGKNPKSIMSNIITGKAGAQVTSERHHAVNPAVDEAFHTYAIEWTPNYVSWTVDGVLVRKTEGGQVLNLTGTQGLRFNLWSSENAAWVGQFDDSILPRYQFINWVKFYKYTPGAGDHGGDFTLEWTDDFDSFDGTRWAKGDWTFEGNRVDLTENNISVKDGMAILSIARKGEEAFTGEVPVDAASFAAGDVALTPYEGAYDGEGHGIGVVATTAIPGLELRYWCETSSSSSMSPSSPSATLPLFTNVCEATVWVEASAPGYITATNSVTVKITKAANAWITEPSIAGWTYGEAARAPQMGKAKFGAAAVSYGATGATPPSAPGSYVATFTVEGTANYAGLTKEVPFTIKSKPTPEPTPTPETAQENFFAGTVDTQFAAKQTLLGALCGADGSVVGTVTLKFGKRDKKGVVKVSASATVIVNGTAKKVGAKAVSFNVDEWGKALTLEFKQPVGGLTLASAADGMFTLGNGRYAMAGLAVDARTGAKRAVKVGGNLADGARTFKVDFKGLPEVEGCLESALPVNVAVTVSGGKRLDPGKAASPKYAKDTATGAYSLVGLDDPAKPNLSGLKLTYAPKTGIFKGSFKLYATTGGDKPSLKKHSVKVIGLMVDGAGVGWATLKKPSAEWTVTIE